MSRRCLICANINPCREHSGDAQHSELRRNDAEITRLTGPDQGEAEAILRGVIKRWEDEPDEGFWRTCSGCHEICDGHDVGHYPYSEAFRCKIGGGCGDCGGLGMIWDNADYDEMPNEPGMVADAYGPVDAGNYPALFKALIELEYANGGVNRERAEPCGYQLPACFASHLEYIDRALATLSDDDLSTFVDGEESEVLAISARSHGLCLAHALLNIVFDSDEYALSTQGTTDKGDAS